MRRLLYTVLFFSLIFTWLMSAPVDSLRHRLETGNNRNEKLELIRQVMADIPTDPDEHHYEIYQLILKHLLILRDEELLAKTHLGLADYHWEKYHTDSAFFHFNLALTYFRALNKRPDEGMVLYKMSMAFYQVSNYNAALQYARESLEIFKEINDLVNQANLYSLLCDIQASMGRKEKAIVDCITSLRILDETGQKQGKANLLNSIGRIYIDLNQLEKSEQYFQEAYQLSESFGDWDTYAQTMNWLGDNHLAKNGFMKAFEYYERALTYYRDKNELKNIGKTLYKLGKAYAKSRIFDQAFEYLNSAIIFADQSKDVELRALIYSELGMLYSDQGDYPLAIRFLKRSIADAQKVDADPILQSCYNNLAKFYDKLGDKENALVYFKLYMLHRESMYQNESAQKITEVEAIYNLEQKEKEIRLLKSENRIKDLEAASKNLINILLVSGLIFVISVTLIIYRQYRLQNKANRLLEMQKDAIHQQKTEIEKQRDNIKKSNMALAESNTQITDSIEYAKRIQLSLLPTGATLKKNFEGSFVLYFPKDIVSGDFYWVYRNADQVLLAVVDCTGHGVHGAFITILSHSLLNQIMAGNKSATPDQIISELDILIRTTLNQQGITLSAFEGMDIAVCSIHLTKGLIEYAGAKMPLYLWQDNQLQQIEGERFSVGGNMITDKKFNLKTLTYHNGDLLYMATDGFQDQFGGSYRKKFMKKHFRALLNRLSTLPIEEQPKMITEVFNSWKGDHPQTDDILILGIKL